MQTIKESPCLQCSRVKSAVDCENKQCRQWQTWFLERWDQIHGYYEKYSEGADK